MTAWLWTMAILYGIDCFARVIWLARQQWPERTSLGIGCDLVINAAMLIWLIAIWK